MEKATIEAKMQALSDEFNQLEVKQQQLQGAYRALEELLQESVPADLATTIVAKEDKKVKAVK